MHWCRQQHLVTQLQPCHTAQHSSLLLLPSTHLVVCYVVDEVCILLCQQHHLLLLCCILQARIVSKLLQDVLPPLLVACH